MKRLLVFLIIFPCLANASIDFQAIQNIESKGNPLAVSSLTKKKIERGLYQVSEAALEDYNQANKTKITASQLFNRRINADVAQWYMLVRIPQMLRYYGHPVNIQNTIIAYNAGISYFIKKKRVPKRTLKYIRDYNQIKRK